MSDAELKVILADVARRQVEESAKTKAEFTPALDPLPLKYNWRWQSFLVAP